MLYVVRDTSTHNVIVMDINNGGPSLHAGDGQELIGCTNLNPSDAQALSHCTSCYTLEQDDSENYYFALMQEKVDQMARNQARPAAIAVVKASIPGTNWDSLTEVQQKVVLGLEPTDTELGLL